MTLIDQSVDLYGARASFGQERLWFLEQYLPGTGIYNIPVVWEFEGLLDLTRLHAALRSVIDGQEALRTGFRIVSGEVTQIIYPGSAIGDRFWMGREKVETVSAAKSRLSAHASTPFDLAVAPLVRCGLIEVGEARTFVWCVMHHIVADGWSVDVFAHSLTNCYAKDVIAEPAIQYADFADWQRERLTGERLQESLGYWLSHMEGAPHSLNLATDFSRPPVKSFFGGTVRSISQGGAAARLQRFAASLGTTPFALIASLLGALLRRYTRQSELCIGYPSAGRSREETENVIGLFINTNVLRFSHRDDDSLISLSRRVHSDLATASDHADLPFEHLVDALGCERNPSTTPLFQVLLVMNDASKSMLRLGQLTGTRQDIRNDFSKFDLTWEINDLGGELELVLTYCKDIFSQTTAQRMGEHFWNLFEGSLARPSGNLRSMNLMSAEEHQRIVHEWNATKSQFSQNRCAHEIFTERAREFPDVLAAIFRNQTLTYRELNTRANALACYLIHLGVTRESVVGVAMDRSLDLVVALLGVMKAGGAFLPLDPSYPIQRLRYMADDARINGLITQEHIRDLIPGHYHFRLLIDRDRTWLHDFAGSEPTTDCEANSLAYVMYTSGSTGSPKGVSIKHIALVNYMLWLTSTYPLAVGDRVLQKTPISFDAAVWDFFMTLFGGATLVLAEPGKHFDVEHLTDLIELHQVRRLKMVPTLLNALIESPRFCRSPLAEVFSGGEELPESLARRVLERMPHMKLYNQYGPTETTINVSCFAYEPGEPGRVPIGKPIANTSLYILDELMNPVPIGIPGELYVGGVQLARGYLNLPDATVERFVVSNTTRVAGERLYRTGDLCRFRSDGNIEYLGRLDQQVKIRGVRIELGEIETALQGIDEVREAVVLAREDEPGDKRLVAYVVPAVDTQLSVSQLRAQLSSFLPEYMVPSAWVFLEALPLNPNGKIDRKALPAPERSRNSLGTEYVPPRNATEELLASIWAEVLKVERVGINDNFFALGGHSLLAARANSLTRKRLDRQPLLKDMFQTADLAAFAAVIDRMPATWQTAPSPLIRTEDLSFVEVPPRIQEAYWGLVEQERSGTRRPWTIEILLKPNRFVSDDEVAALARKLAHRHRVLATRFDIRNGRLGLVHTGIIPIVTRRSVDSSGNASTAALLDEVRSTSIIGAPLAKVVHVHGDPSTLIFVIEHIICDQHSRNIVLQDARRLIDSPGEQGQAPPDYLDYCQLLQSSPTRLAASRSYWAKELDPPLPRSHWTGNMLPAPPYDLIEWSEDVEIVGPLLTALDHLAQKRRTTIFCVLFAIFAQHVSRILNVDRFDIETHVEGRYESNAQNLVGLFMNTLLIRLHRQEVEKSLSNAITIVSKRFFGGLDNAEVPYYEIRRCSDPNSGPSDFHWPLLFTYQKTSTDIPFELRLSEDSQLRAPRPAKNFMEVVVIETNRGLTTRFMLQKSRRLPDPWKDFARVWYNGVLAAGDSMKENNNEQ